MSGGKGKGKGHQAGTVQHVMGAHGPSPGQMWKQHRSAAASQMMATKAAAQAQRCADAAAKVQAMVSDAGSVPPRVGDLELASKHFRSVGASLDGCPEARAAAEAKASQLADQAFAARPLAQQITMMENSLRSRMAEHQKLKSQVAVAQTRLATLETDGHELERKLIAARVQLASAPATPVDGGGHFGNPVSALGEVSSLVGLLPPQMATGLAQCLHFLQQMAAEQARVVASPAPATFADVVVASEVNPLTGGSGVVVAGTADNAQAANAATAPMELGFAPARATFESSARSDPYQGRTASAGSGAPPPSLFQQCLPSRRTRAGRSPAPRQEAVDDDFIPVVGRSRSEGGRRLIGKQREYSAEEGLHVAVMDGARYFSRLASETAANH
jgi:hypothetical protein